MSKKNTKTVIILLVIAVLIAAIPLFALKDAEFGGSDDAGSVMIEEIEMEYTPWFTPVLETALGRELPGEVESLIFCIQTERRKWQKATGQEDAVVPEKADDRKGKQ